MSTALDRPFVRRSRVPLLEFALVVVLLAIAAGAAALVIVSPGWRSTATVVVVAPQTGTGTPAAGNPLLRHAGRAVELAALLATAVTSPGAETDLHRLGGDGAVSIATRDGVLRLTATASTRSAAGATADALVSVARDQLVALQNRSDVSGTAQATLTELGAASRPHAVHGRQWSAAGWTVLVVVVLALLIGVFGLWGRGGPAMAPASRPVTRRRRRAATTPRSR